MLFLLVTLFTSPLYGESLKLDLETARQLAIMSDSDIKVGRMNMRLKRRAYIFSFTRFAPQFSTSFSLSNAVLYDNMTETTTYYNDPYLINVGLSVNQLVFDGGQSISDSYFKYYELALMTKELDEKMEQLNGRVEELYSSLAFALKKVKEQENHLAYMDERLKIIEEKRSMELITELDYREYLLGRNEAEIGLSQARRNYRFLLLSFQALLGIEEDVELTTNFDLDYPLVDLKLAPYFQELALSNTVKSQSVRLNLYKTKAQQVTTYLSLSPQVNLNFTYEFEGQGFPLYKKGWNLGINFKWALPGFPVDFSQSYKFPTDDGDKLKQIDQSRQMLGELKSSASIKYFAQMNEFNKFEKANIDLYKAKSDFDEYRRRTANSVLKFVEEYNEQVRMSRLKAEKIKLLEERLEILKLRYELGEARVIDIMENENKLFSARLAQIDSKNRLAKLVISIKAITGLNSDELFATIKESSPE